MIHANKPKILLVELDYHSDLFSFFIELCDENKFQIFCLTKQIIYNQLSTNVKSKANFIIVKKNSEIKTFLSKHHFDFTFFNTCEKKLKFWSKHCPNNTLLRIHDVNTHFNAINSIYVKFNFLSLRKAFIYLITRQLFSWDFCFMNKFLKKVNYYSFISNQNKEYFLKVRPDLKDKTAHTFPFASYNQDFFKDNLTEAIRIVIPGTLEAKRKDFKAIFQACKFLSESEHKIQLIFAGKAGYDSKNLVAEIKKLENNNFKSKFFNSYLDYNEFDQLVKDADILFFPMTATTNFKIFKEIYGKSKTSGSIKDMIKFGKLSVIPNWYILDEDLNKLSFKYNSVTDISSTFKNIVDFYLQNHNEYIKIVEMHKKNYSFDKLFEMQNNLISYYISHNEKN